VKPRGSRGQFKRVRRAPRFVPNAAPPGWARKARVASGVALPRAIEADVVACAGYGGFTADQVAARLGLDSTVVDSTRLARLVAAVRSCAGMDDDPAIGAQPQALAAMLVRLVAIRIPQARHAAFWQSVADTLDGPIIEPAELSLFEGQVAPDGSCLAALPVAVVRMLCIAGATGRFSSRQLYHAMDLHGFALSDRSIRTRLQRARHLILASKVDLKPIDPEALATAIADYLRSRGDLFPMDVVGAARARLGVSAQEAPAP